MDAPCTEKFLDAVSQGVPGEPTDDLGQWLESSRLLDIIFHGLTCGGYLHFCDVNQILIRVDVSLRVNVVSFMTLKNFRIVHFPGPLFGNIAAIPVSP